MSWFAFGPDGGSARSFASDPTDHSHLYLGTANGWIYQSRDGGKKWERLARVGKRDDLVIDDIVVDPTQPKHLVVGAWVVSDGGGIFVSDDGGVTWKAQPEMLGQSVRALSESQSNPKIFVAGTLEGVFRSTDSGAHWERISPKDNAEIHEIESLAIDPSDPNIIYAGTWHLPWKTTDGGKKWSNIKQGIIEDSDVFSIIVDPKESNVLYLSACSGIYKSDNSGAKFAKVQGIPSTARRTRVLMQDPNNLSTVYAGTTEGLYRTFDAGKYWMQTTPADVIVNDVYVDPSNSKHVLLATDRRGVLASDDGGDSFRASNTGFSARLITAFASDAQHPATVYVGVVNDKDSGGVFISRTGGLSWSHLSDGLDGRDVFSLIQAPDGSMLAGTEHGIYRLKDSAWQRVGEGSDVTTSPEKSRPEVMTKKQATRPPRGARHRQVIKSHPAVAASSANKAVLLKGFDGSVYGFARTGDSLYAATSAGLLRSVSSGTTWSLVSSLPRADFRFVAAQKDVIVAASLSSIETSLDSGKSWQPLPPPDAGRHISALAVDGRGMVWVGDRDGLYYAGGKGANWRALTDLVVRKVNSLYFDEKSNRMLVTANEPVTEAFAVAIPSLRVTSWDTGWNLRFVRPVGDHLVGVTLFDGIVVQPRMVDSAEIAAH